MHARFAVIALALTSLLLVTMAAACTSWTGGSENASGWRDFVIVPNSPDANPVGTIDQMERIGGFAFVFPSYLPDGMDNKIMLDAWAQTTGTIDGVVEKGGPGEEVDICRAYADAPCITIGEIAQPFPNNFPISGEELEHITIAATDIACLATAADNGDNLKPAFSCDWVAGDRAFRIVFDWKVDHAIAGHITEEMRQEAMKVIESMIVAPEHP
jgi:hypothetical protein